MLKAVVLIAMSAIAIAALLLAGRQFILLPMRFTKQLAKIAKLRPNLAGLASRDAYLNDKAYLDAEKLKHKRATEELYRAERDSKKRK